MPVEINGDKWLTTDEAKALIRKFFPNASDEQVDYLLEDFQEQHPDAVKQGYRQ